MSSWIARAWRMLASSRNPSLIRSWPSGPGRLRLGRERMIELLARDRAMPEQDLAQARAFAEGVEHRIELLLRENFLADENLSERRAVVLEPLSRQRIGQLVLGDQSALNEQLAQSKFTGHHRHALNTQPGPARRIAHRSRGICFIQGTHHGVTLVPRQSHSETRSSRQIAVPSAGRRRSRPVAALDSVSRVATGTQCPINDQSNRGAVAWIEALRRCVGVVYA